MLAFTETAIAPGSDVARRMFSAAHEVLHVLDGTLSLRLGDDELDAVPGTFICSPPGVAHTLANRGEKPVRFLDLAAPAG